MTPEQFMLHQEEHTHLGWLSTECPRCSKEVKA